MSNYYLEIANYYIKPNIEFNRAIICRMSADEYLILKHILTKFPIYFFFFLSSSAGILLVFMTLICYNANIAKKYRLNLGGIGRMLRTILAILFCIVCIVFSALVLSQEGNEQGLGGSVGGMGDTYWSKNKGRSAEGWKEKGALFCAVAFLVLAFLLNLV